MATFAIRPISPVKAKGDEEFVTYPLAAAQTFTTGAPAILTSGGTVQETGADPASILGFFMADAADYDWKDDTFGNVSPAVPIALADQEFRGTLLGTYDAAVDVGRPYGLASSAGTWVVDRAETTATRVVITGVEDDAVDGDINVPVTFRVMAANRQVTG
jgi:hypothetical protein